MLQEMGLDRDACTEYLATSGALAASGVENDAFRMTPNHLNHHVQSSEWIYRSLVVYNSFLFFKEFANVASNYYAKLS